MVSYEKKALKKPSAIGRDGFGYSETSQPSIWCSKDRSKYDLRTYLVFLVTIN
jgi:hypothetical protein